MPGRFWIIVGSLLAALSVAVGAFGAHGLKQELKAGRITPEQFSTFETAARNQMFHSIALVLVGLAVRTGGPSVCTKIAGTAFLMGIILFCGWLYANALWGHTSWPLLAPAGGTLFIIGWIALAIAGWHATKKSPS